ncbi:conserved hypothetical protein [Candidatus Roizmanbacteria bacterium]|nr:conserved hypothetical protein [Candidatus Roizmanbacteria bacterium]
MIKIITKLLRKQLFISIFIGSILFVGLIVLIKLPFRKTTNLYVTVKLNQGFWWANTPKPGIWFLEALKKGEKEHNLLNEPIAEIIGVRYYQQTNSDLNQFDIYLSVKLSVEDNENKGYMFKRTKIAVGSPIDMDFTGSQITGTIVSLDVRKSSPNYIEKNITLTKKFAFPWEYEAIKIGDRYFNGEENVFEIIDKQAFDTLTITSDAYGNILPQVQELRKYIIVKAKIKLTKNSFNQFIFGEEQVIKINSYANLTTNNMVLSDFNVASLD